MERKLWTPSKGGLKAVSGLWLPGVIRRRHEAEDAPHVPNRAEIRAALHRHRIRDDASPLTKPSLDQRRTERRRRNRAARVARRAAR